LPGGIGLSSDPFLLHDAIVVHKVNNKQAFRKSFFMVTIFMSK